jgi:hypothetical protein
MEPSAMHCFGHVASVCYEPAMFRNSLVLNINIVLSYRRTSSTKNSIYAALLGITATLTRHSLITKPHLCVCVSCVGCTTTSACPPPCTRSPMDPARPRDPARPPTPPATDAAGTELTPSSPEPSPLVQPRPSVSTTRTHGRTDGRTRVRGSLCIDKRPRGRCFTRGEDPPSRLHV